MMKPTLTVEGKELEVINVSYFNNVPREVITLNRENNDVKHFHDIGHKAISIFESTAIEMEKAFSYKHDFVEAIQKRIFAHEERMAELTYEFMELAISSDAVFPENEGAALKTEFAILQLQVEGLVEAIRIISPRPDAEEFVSGVQREFEKVQGAE